MWQAAHSVFSPLKTTTFGREPFAFAAPLPPPFFPFAPAAAAPGGTWHAAHFAVACLPVRANVVFAAWSKGTPRKDFSLWQLAQSCLNSPRCGSWWHVAQVPAFSLTFVAGSLWQAAH